MAFLFDTEEEQQTSKNRRSAALGRAVGADTEIALGTRSLLGIFFGLVLICAVFFGLGYSVGRGSGSRGPGQVDAAATSAASDTHLSKPSPQQSLTPVEPGPADGNQNPAEATPAESESTPAQPPASTFTQPATTRPATASPSYAQPAATKTPSLVPTPRPAPTAAAPAPGSGAGAETAPAVQSFMVQVAAVRVPQDADILVDALRKRGYTAVVRHEAQDQLLHVQLGPFTSRADANTMRTKLLSDGYNAVLK